MNASVLKFGTIGSELYSNAVRHTLYRLAILCLPLTAANRGSREVTIWRGIKAEMPDGDVAPIYLTPGLKLQFLPGGPFRPFVAAGAGFGDLRT